MSVASGLFVRLASRRSEDSNLLKGLELPVTFRMSKWMFALSAAVILLGLTFIAAGFYLDFSDNRIGFWLMVAFGLLTLFGAAYLLWWTYQFRFIVSRDRIRFRQTKTWIEFSIADMQIEERNHFLLLRYPGGSHNLAPTIENYPVLASLLLRLTSREGRER